MLSKDDLKDVFYNGETHAVYTDTDSVVIDGHDKTLCMYDYADIILKIADLTARRGDKEK